MGRQMNSILTQAAAVGIIALVALFPTKERLKEALSPLPSEISSPVEITDAVMVKSPVYSGKTLTVQAPFPLRCATETVTGNDLGLCATELSDYIVEAYATKEVEPEALALIAPDALDTPDPRVEQARRALVEICRLRWSNPDPVPDARFDTACKSL